MMSEISSGWPHMWPISMAKGSSETLLMMMKSFTLPRGPPLSIRFSGRACARRFSLVILVRAPVSDLDGYRSRMPNVPVVFQDGAVRRELAHARHVEDGHARPFPVIAVQLRDLLLAGDVFAEVGH